MILMENPIPKIAIREKVPPLEVRYGGNKGSLREISSSPKDTARINVINNGLSTKEYDDSGPETQAETMAWLNSRDLRRAFASLKPVVGVESIVGVEKATPLATPDIIIGKYSGLGELAAYTYIYDHRSPVVDKITAPEGTIQKEISFVTDLPDSQRSPEEMAEAMQQTAMMLWEIQSGKTTAELTGSFTPAQLEQAKKLQIFTSAGAGADEANYRIGLVQAGFKELDTYDYEGDLQHVYALDLDALIATMATKKAAASQ